jgi:serine/threonine protein kinase
MSSAPEIDPLAGASLDETYDLCRGRDEARIGEVLADRYELTSILGRGATGVVYRARQTAIARDVAIKIVRTSIERGDDAIERFEREARIIARLRHPNTIRLFDTGCTPNGEPFLVTELLSGRSLRAALAGGTLGPERIVSILDQVAGSLVEAHAAGIVHRDIKPENIFLDQIGDEDFVKVLDFGIARDATLCRVTQAGIILGTPAYIAPENIADVDEADPRGDIYGLGVLLYEMLSGAPPFEGATLMETLAMHLYRVPTAIWTDGQVDRNDARFHLQELALAMLAKSPAARPQTMNDVRRAIQRIRQRPHPTVPRHAAMVDGAPPVRPEGWLSSELVFDARPLERVTQISAGELTIAREKWLRDRVPHAHAIETTIPIEQPLAEEIRVLAQQRTRVPASQRRRLRAAGVILLLLAATIFAAAKLLVGGGAGQ